jgi:hypothetical protein
LVPVAFDLKVAISNDYTVYVLSIDDWARYQEVGQLNLKEHDIVIKEEQSSID